MASEMRYNPMTNERYLAIHFEQLMTWAKEEAIYEIVAKEVQKALVESEDFRILVREGIREAMGKLNITEVVQAAVNEVINAQKAQP